MLLIRLLCAPAYSCFGVGDDDQVIYGYAGATPEYLINFGDYFPGARNYALEINYRCPPAVVRAATSVLSYNVDRIHKTIGTPMIAATTSRTSTPSSADAGPVAVVQARSAELPQTAWRSSRLVEGRRPLEEIAVLTRVNSSLLPVQVALAEAGIPCNAPLNTKALERTGVRTALAYLRMGLIPERSGREDVVQTIRRPSRGIAPNVRPRCCRNGPRPRSPTSDAWPVVCRDETCPSCSDYADAIDAVAAACRNSTAAAVRAIRVEVGLGETMDVLDSSQARGGSVDPCR